MPPEFQRKIPVPTDPTPLRDKPRGARFDLLGPQDTALILAIAQRAAQLAQQWRMTNPNDTIYEANPTVIQLDIAVTHLCRNLKLRDFLHAPSLDFIAENTTIQQNIIRPLTEFPRDVPLRFAQSGAIHRNIIR